MQDINFRNSLFRRCFVFLIVFVFALGFFPVGAFASESSSSSSLTNWEDSYVFVTNYFEVGARAALAGISDFIWGSSGSAVNEIKNSAFYCSSNTVSDAAVPPHLFDGVVSSFRDGVCSYCGISWSDFLLALESDEDDYVSTLDSTSASSGISVSGFSVSSIGRVNLSNGSYKSITSYSNEWKSCLYNAYLGNKAVVIGVYSKYIWGYFWDSDGMLCRGVWSNPLGVTNASALGVYALSDLSLISSDCSFASFPVYFSKSCAESSLGTSFVTSSVYAVDWDSQNSGGSFYCFFKSSVNVVWSESLSSVGIGGFTPSQVSFTGGSYAYAPTSADAVAWNTSHIVVAPSGTDSTSRVSSLTQSIIKYNSGNNWVDNSTTVNYFIGTVGEDGTVSDVYDIALYDEETLIFTEPVTGAQYQTSGWTYYYTTRSYDIDVESGTFAIGDSDITQIICTYGDDAVSIGYYDSSGSEVQTDEYAYVMVSQSQCSLTGHVNTVATTKEPTCTRTGERTYTCSVCGNVSVEDIPMMGHSKQYSEFKSPTCTDSGLALYSCTTCGDEVSENIDPLGHDWLATEVVATTYSLPDGTSCPECSGTDFTGVLDDVNQIYNCACNSCAAAWTVSADATLGYTVYTCSRCEKTRIEYDGEDGDGLFKSIGNFIANGLTWCTEKLSQLVDNFTSILDTFNEYTELVGAQNSSYPSFLTAVIDGLPADLMAVVWFAVMVFVVLAVIKIFFR